MAAKQKNNGTGGQQSGAAGPGERTAIAVRGARVHNLKNISLDIPRNTLTVITGVSGSGKSSLAFDTLYAEGQRRYVESLSSYARQFLERMDKPDVDSIQGMSPAIAIEQKTTGRNPRSTVATTTEIYDYLRLLFGRIGTTYCPRCGELVQRDTVSSVVDRIASEQDGTKFLVAFPLHSHEGHTLQEELDAIRKRGFFRIVHAGETIDLNETEFKPKAKEKAKKDVSVLIDRLVLRRGNKDMMQRLADSLETAFREGEGYALIHCLEPASTLKFSRHYECRNDGTRFEDPDPKFFAFNSPIGACPSCQGFGRAMGIDMALVVPDPTKTLRQGAIAPWTTPRWEGYFDEMMSVGRAAGLPVDVPYLELSQQHKDLIMNGGRGFKGLKKFFKYLEEKSYKIQYRVLLSRYRGYTTCDACGGSRLRPEAINIRVGGKTIHDVVRMTISAARQFFETVQLTEFDYNVARRILEEIRKRLAYLDNVGIGYLTLDRLTMTLSGGEAQRISLSTALGSSLVGSLYVLDEPSIGLHARDNQKLIDILKRLRDLGNTVVVVEHDEDMIEAADTIVDMGPKAGEFGGEVVFCGPQERLAAADTLTSRYLDGRMSIPVPARRRTSDAGALVIHGAAEHNLRSVDVAVPLKRFVCVTGVSGSGKSTLVHSVLYEGLKKLKEGNSMPAAAYRSIEGAALVEGVEMVDQSPIGRSPRSNPVTYLKIFDGIRDLLAGTQAARMRGFPPGHFSFNVPGGRCEVCEGDGVQKIEMQFLADLFLTCEGCKGKRFKQEVLDVRYHGKNVDDILGMTATEALEFFSASPETRKIAQRLKVLNDVGLGYIRLGQPGTTLSGGEAQRVKLASHLSDSASGGGTLFIFDEPTTGLHFDDIAKLLRCFDALIESGHSVLVIEHNMHVIKCADTIIDLGPEGGDAGGAIVAVGTPEQIAAIKVSHTGRLLAPYLKSGASKR